MLLTNLPIKLPVFWKIILISELLISCYWYLANIFRGRIQYELIYSSRGASHRVDYSLHIRWDRERYLLYYIENYWNKNCKPKLSNYWETNQHFYFFKLLQTFIKQPGSPLCFYLSDWSGDDIQQLVKCKSVTLFNNYHYCNSLPIQFYNS